MELSTGQIATRFIPSGDDKRIGYICYDLLFEVANMRGLEQKFALHRVCIVLVELRLECIIETLAQGAALKHGKRAPWSNKKKIRAEESLIKYQEDAIHELLLILMTGKESVNWNILSNLGLATVYLWHLPDAAPEYIRAEMKRSSITVRPKDSPPHSDIA